MAEVTATSLAARRPVPLRFDLRTGAAAWAAAGGLTVLVLLAPALWNGFPIIFPDTGNYMMRPLLGTLDLGRSAFYGLFLVAGMRLGFWPNIVAQSALTVWIVALTMRAHGFGRRPWLVFAVVALLSAATSLPWVAGELLPDILFPLAVLALYLLVFHSGLCAPWERFALAGVIACAIASHMAALGLCVGLIGALWLIDRLTPLTRPRPLLRYGVLAVLAGALLCPVSNWAITGSFAFTPGGSSFLFGRMVEDGLIARYLADHCPDPALRLCAYKSRMPDDADGWLWDPQSPYNKLGGWQGIGDEERRIVLAALVHYPLSQLEAAVNDVVQQLTSFQTEVSLDDNEPTLDAVRDHAARWLPRLMAARQQKRRVNADILNLVDVPVAAFAMLGLFTLLTFRRRLGVAPELAALGATILLALFINAAICGVLSHAVDRYQSRLTPLALFAVALAAIDHGRRGRPRARAPAGPPQPGR